MEVRAERLHRLGQQWREGSSAHRTGHGPLAAGPHGPGRAGHRAPLTQGNTELEEVTRPPHHDLANKRQGSGLKQVLAKHHENRHPQKTRAADGGDGDAASPPCRSCRGHVA